MAKARKIVLSTITFEKARDGTQFFRDMLYRNPIGARIPDDDAKHLAALLDRHDDKAEKIGPGIGHFEVRKAPDDHRGQCFWLIRTDSTAVDVSFTHCLERKLGD